ncbi:MAG: hypothetical protein BWY54_00965 [Candidatus Dependentiae bacterium ADurb.Bin331]|nr:MAG: hypothetical protein BWY54_00965 [Candidatus Dependentiae bacterium ADurb.Bin331]
MQAGFNGTFTSLQAGFGGTFTVLNTIVNSFSIADVRGVYTALAACCNGTFTALQATFTNVQAGFNGTFSVLQAGFGGTFTQIQAGFNGTFTSLQNNFGGTFTVLNTIVNSFSIADVRGVYTALAACCNGTFTALQAGFGGTFTVERAGFNGTFTALQAGFNGTFTALQATFTNIQAGFNGTFSVLQAGFGGTFTQMRAGFNGTFTQVQAGFNGTFTAVKAGFDGTFTAIAACCVGTFSTLKNLEFDNCNPVYITQASFGATGATTFTISTTGVYKLAANVTFSPAAAATAINITASGVILDLQCFSITQGNAVAGVDGIRTANSLSNVMITNGMLQNFTNSGINTGNNLNRLKITDLTCIGCGLRGIQLNGSSGARITQSLIDGCSILQCGQSSGGDRILFLQFCSDVNVTNCYVNANGSAANNIQVVRLENCLKCNVTNVVANDNIGNSTIRGFSLNNVAESTFRSCEAKNNISNGNNHGYFLETGSTSTANQFLDCVAVALTGSAAVDGFLTDTGCNNNVFINCRALVNTSTGSGTTNIVHGFNFINNTGNSCIDCIAQNNSAPSSTAAFGSVGLELNTTTSCSLIRCNGSDQSTGGSSTSVGVRVSGGISNVLTDNMATNQSIGFRIDPNLSTSHGFSRNIAIKNLTQFSQFIGGSTQAAANIAEINGSLTSPWSNVAIG